MKAVLMQSGRLWQQDLPMPEPQRGEVLVRTCACGICGTDLHAVKHTEALIKTSREVGGGFKLTTDQPVVLGHEFCAEIIDYGAGYDQDLCNRSIGVLDACFTARRDGWVGIQ